MSIAEMSFNFTGTFEAELLIELMLRYWNHPSADDAEFRNSMIESASEVLQASMHGEKLLEGVDPPNMNLVSAVWTSEYISVTEESSQVEADYDDRQKWLLAVRHALPSCFCNQNMLE